METDAFLILVLSVYVVPVAGAWVLLIGLARYLLLLATGSGPGSAARAAAPVGQGRGRRPGHRAGRRRRRASCHRVARQVAARSRPWRCSLESFGRQVVGCGDTAASTAVPRSPLVRPVLDVLAWRWSGWRWCCRSDPTS